MQFVISARSTVLSIEIEIHGYERTSQGSNGVKRLVQAHLSAPQSRHPERSFDALLIIADAVSEWLCTECPLLLDGEGSLELA